MRGRSRPCSLTGLALRSREPDMSAPNARSRAMGTPPRRRATYDDLRSVPGDRIAEIIDGELVTSPRPASRHGYAHTRIVSTLDGAFGEPGSGGPGGWWVLLEPELHLQDDVLVPDVAAWRRERMPELPDVPAFTLAPDWVCEVISPGSGRVDRAKKLPIYAREGVGHLWLVDPLARTLETYRLEGGRWSLLATHGGDDCVRAEPFGAIELPLARWWLPEITPATR